MMEFQDMIFIGEIALQSKIAQRAAERLSKTQSNFDRIEVWCSIQSILVAGVYIDLSMNPSLRGSIFGETLTSNDHRHFGASAFCLM